MVVDNTGNVVAGYDYDAWGYPLENRTYNGDSIKYKYTGKELDKESFYDYFGARYYDARIANWTSVDPLMEKHFDFSPYNYVLRNPLELVDPDGQQISTIQGALNIYNWYKNEKIESDYYSSLSLVGKEEYSREYIENMGNSGKIEATGDEMIFAGLISEGIGLVTGKFTSSFAMKESNSIVKGINALVSTELNLSKHATKQMIERSITKSMIQKTLEKGNVFWDQKVRRTLTFWKTKWLVVKV